MSQIRNPRDNLSLEEKRSLLAKMLREKLNSESNELPLSQSQRMLWLIQQLHSDCFAYNISARVRLAAPLTGDALDRSIARLTQRHPQFRTTFSAKDGHPVQTIHPNMPPRVERVNAVHWTDVEFRQRMSDEADRRFDLEKGPVIRFALFERNDSQTLQMTMHHICGDFWSLMILLDELSTVYAGELQGVDIGPFDPPPSLRDYIHSQQKWLTTSECERQWNYWQQQLAGPLPSLELPSDRPRPPIPTFRGATRRLNLSDDLSRRIRNRAAAERVTPFMTVLGAFAVLLYRYTGQTDLLIGCPTSGRDRGEWHGLVANLSNPVALRIGVSGECSFRDVLSTLRKTVVEALENQHFPFPLLVERLHVERDLSRHPIFQVMFAWEKPIRPQNARSQSDVFAYGNFESEQRGAPFDLTVQVFDDDGPFRVQLQYSSDLFDDATMARMAGHFESILEAVAQDSNLRVEKTPLLTARERATVLGKWNDTQKPFELNTCLHTLFERQVTRTPDDVAVDASFDRGGGRRTFDELNRRANRTAHYLRATGIDCESLVGVCMERSMDMVVALLAILKAGAAYVPLDPEYPAERLAFMVQDSTVPIILTHERLRDRLPATSTVIVALDSIADDLSRQRDDNPDAGCMPHNAAYAIYTSGSTGQPKAAVNEHRGVVNRLLWMQSEYPLDATDRVVQKTPYSFDVSVWEFFWPLITGARLVMARPAGHRDSGYLARLFAEQRITTCHFVPSMLSLFLEEKGIVECRSLRRVICSGEALSRELQDRFFDKLPCELHNLYGPTEAAVDVTFHHCRPQREQHTVPIGRPIANTRIYLLDAVQQPVPVGVPGELYIGGVAVGRGYLNRPELTEQKFLFDPFSDQPHARMYRTGDLARYRADGSIEYLGRADDQVKLRGFRIELGEIEQCLSTHPRVREATVARFEQNGHEPRLVAYIVVSANGTAPVHAHDDGTLGADVRQWLQSRLPDYLVPQHFEVIDAIPRLPNGKVNRRGLPAPRIDREPGRPYVAPRSEMEKQLAAIWATVLGLEAPGIDDNFFALGGASLEVLRVVHEAEKQGISITPEMLFQHQTVRDLATTISTTPQRVKSSHQEEVAHRCEVSPVAIPDTTAPSKRVESTVIESLGYYLPARALSTDEVLQGCRHSLDFPLERMTGIRSRRVAAENEFAIDLARAAVRDCLNGSAYRPEDVGVVIGCNVSRCDGPQDSFSFEPSTAVRLKAEFGMRNAICFDISNACAGMFTGIYIIDALLEAGIVSCGMAVSGEYTTHLIRTAQHEIDGYMDPRLACLTVGDAGAAVILDRTTRPDVGFQHLGLYTLGKYSDFCIGKATNGSVAGAIMVTDMLQDTAVSIREGVRHAANLIEKHGWAKDSLEHLILHQTSDTAIKGAMRELNAAFGKDICTERNTLSNLAERGNTASTTHFVALADQILAGNVQDGDHVVFGISGSGKTTGTALYSLDELPSRLRAQKSAQAAVKTQRSKPLRPLRHDHPRVRIVSRGIADTEDVAAETLDLIESAANRCLERSGRDRNDVDLMIHAGVYRSDFICEPALAALAAGRLKINDDFTPGRKTQTFVFDVMNGGTSFINACQVASEMLRIGRHRLAMVVASEIENNREHAGLPRLGIVETATALMLELSDEGEGGFGAFQFSADTEYIDAYSTSTAVMDAAVGLAVEQSRDMQPCFVQSITRAVDRFLEVQGLDRSDIAVLLPPQISSSFIEMLAGALGFDRRLVIDATLPGGDLFTSALVLALDQVERQSLASPGDVGLIVGVGAGVQVGCALYYF